MDNNMREIFSKMFLWLCLGLLVTFGVAYFIQDNEPLINDLFTGGKYLFVWIAEIVVAIILSARIHKMKPVTAGILYIIYTALTGLTFSTIFILYEITSIIYIFGITAIVLFIFGLIGYKTKLDLTKISTFLFMGLIAIIILSIVSVFVDSVALNLGITILSLLIFMAYIAYDIHVIKKRLYYTESEDSLAIYGAFQLYLDFINIFLDLLSLFGKEK